MKTLLSIKRNTGFVLCFCFLALILFGVEAHSQTAVNEDYRLAWRTNRDGNIETLRDLLKKNPALAKQKDSSYPGETLLHAAAGKMSGLTGSEIVTPTVDLEMVKLLLETGAEINALDDSGETALIDASKQGNLKIVEYLIEQKADLNVKNSDGLTALHFAAGTARRETAKLLLSKGLSLKERNNNGLTPFHLACQTKYSFEHIEDLIKAGADINERDKEGYSPIFYAVNAGNLNSVKLLIENKADFNSVEILSAVLLFNENNSELAEFLLKNGANTELKNGDGETVLHSLVITNLTENLKLLLKYKANPNAVNNQGETSLHRAVKSAHTEGVIVEVVKQLLAAKANPSIKDKQGQTAFDLAKSNFHNEVAALLKPESLTRPKKK